MNESQKGTTLTAEELERGRKLLAAIPRDDLGRPYFHLGSTTTPAAVDLVVYLVQHAEDFLAAARRVEELEAERDAVDVVREAWVKTLLRCVSALVDAADDVYVEDRHDRKRLRETVANTEAALAAAKRHIDGKEFNSLAEAQAELVERSAKDKASHG